MNDAKFEPYAVRRSMQDLRYELQHSNQLVVHVRPSIPLLPAGVRAPDLVKRIESLIGGVSGQQSLRSSTDSPGRRSNRATQVRLCVVSFTQH